MKKTLLTGLAAIMMLSSISGVAFAQESEEIIMFNTVDTNTDESVDSLGDPASGIPVVKGYVEPTLQRGRIDKIGTINASNVRLRSSVNTYNEQNVLCLLEKNTGVSIYNDNEPGWLYIGVTFGSGYNKQTLYGYVSKTFVTYR